MLGAVGKKSGQSPLLSGPDQPSRQQQHMASTATSSLSIVSPDLCEPVAKKRRLEVEDLFAFEELDDDFDREWQANDRFDILCSIGSGAYATVYKAIDRERENALVAVKKMIFRVDPVHTIPPHITREVTNLCRLQSRGCEPPIVRLLDAVSSQGRYDTELIVHLVFEYMDQDLDSCIRHSLPRGLDEPTIKNYLHQILVGVEWMHSNDIIHRDLKPQNILVSRGVVKIADFGLSRAIDDNIVLSTQVVTQWYRSPEVLLQSSYSKEVDIWSVGCILAEMYIGRPLFVSKRSGEIAQLEEIFRTIGTPSFKEWPPETPISHKHFKVVPPRSWIDILPRISQNAQDLLSKMLIFQSAERVTADKALEDSFFQSVPSMFTAPTPSPSISQSPSRSPSPYFSPSPSLSLSPTPSLQDHTHTPLSVSTECSQDSGIHDI